jgi:type IV pilus assembly protein PilZ
MQVLLLDFEDFDELYRCYMPALKHGGLFVKTNSRFDMGQPLSLRVTMPDALEEDVIEGKVVWITPQGAQIQIHQAWALALLRAMKQSTIKS